MSTVGSTPLYVASWGWNSNGRCGNLTSNEINIPKQIQRQPHVHYIDCVASKHHTLLLSDEGKVYGLGDNRKGQLGIGNQFTNKNNTTSKPKIQEQSIAIITTPSGSYKNKCDIKTSQVAGGGSFSLAKELSLNEGVELVVGFKQLEQSILRLKSIYPESLSIQLAWSHIRQEKYVISITSEGQVLVWGSGHYGELGLGIHIKSSVYPQPILYFKNNHISISSLSAGKKHVLAIDTSGRIYSWGCGSGGRLGHGDFLDRHSPEVITFFNSLYVISCAAGDAHSAVITIMRNLTTTTNSSNSTSSSNHPNTITATTVKEMRRISTFGRGAHGRLGNGTNRNICKPILVSKWPLSLRTTLTNIVQFHQVACGGAHTVLLVSKEVPISLVFPFGRQTYVITWGYGMNGQLGTRYQVDSYIPIKAKMPKGEVIVEVSAGKSWSMARSIGGDLYTWGKGLRGQLGQDQEKFCFGPRKINSFASFIKITSNYAHNVCLAIPKKYLNIKIAESVFTNNKNKNPDHDFLNQVIPLKLKKKECISYFKFDCCRRLSSSYYQNINNNNAIKDNKYNNGEEYVIGSSSSSNRYNRKPIRFNCIDCMINCICMYCARLCHRNHRLLDMNALLYKVPASKVITTPDDPSITASNNNNNQIKKIIRNIVFNNNKAQSQSVDKPDITTGDACVALELPYLNHNNNNNNLEDYLKDTTHDLRTSTSQPLSYYCSLLYLSNSNLLRPKKGRLEIYPKLSMFDINPYTETSLLTDQEYHILNKQPREIQRRSRETASKREIHPKFLQINPRIHSSIIHNNSRDGINLIAPTCHCGTFNSHCKLLPMIPESSLEYNIDIITNNTNNIDTQSLVAYRLQGNPDYLSTKKSSVLVSPEIKAIQYLKKKEMKKIKNINKENDVIDHKANIPTITTTTTTRDIIDRGGFVGLANDIHQYQLTKHVGIQEIAIKRIQKYMKIYVLKRINTKKYLKYMILRREVCTKYYYQQILNVIFTKVNQSYEIYRQQIECNQMNLEEKATERYQYYHSLQLTLAKINACIYGTRKLFGFLSPKIPRVHNGRITNAWRSSFAFSWASIRSQQLHLHPKRRIPVALLTIVTKHLPRTHEVYKEGKHIDPDLYQYTYRYQKDLSLEKWRRYITKLKLDKKEKLRKFAEKALEKLKLKQNAKKLLLMQAEKISLANQNKSSQIPKPPEGPPPRHAVIESQRLIKLGYNKKEQQIENEIQKQYLLEDQEFSIKQEFPLIIYPRRRYTITDSSRLFLRLVEMRKKMTVGNRMKRTNSLPSKLSLLYVDYKQSIYQTKDHIQQIKESLVLFYERYQLIDKLEKQIVAISTLEDPSKAIKRCEYKMIAISKTPVLTPKLPIELYQMLKFPSRRRTIADPERISRQLALSIDIREKFASLVDVAKANLSYNRRRRSFDMGECQDITSGVNEILGFEFEENLINNKVTAASLIKDSKIMLDRMIHAKMIEATKSSNAVGITSSSNNVSEQDVLINKLLLKQQEIQEKVNNNGIVKPKKKVGVMNATRVTASNNNNTYNNKLLKPSINNYMSIPIQQQDDYNSNDYNSVTASMSGYNDSIYSIYEEDSAVYSVVPINNQEDLQLYHIWQEHYDTDGKAYYYNAYTSESKWDLSTDYLVQIETQNQDENGYWYWFNNVTGAVTYM